jgi:hypothetical protein
MADHCGCGSSPDWADLPGDLLGRIFQLLQLPEALAVAAVCTSWRSAAVAAGDPRGCWNLPTNQSHEAKRTHAETTFYR